MTIIIGQNRDCLYEAITALPIKAPIKPKMKVQPYHIQNIKNTHWVALKFGYRQMPYPFVSHTYFHVDDSYAELFKTTWNLFGKFPKHVEGNSFDAETDELIEIKSSNEEE